MLETIASVALKYWVEFLFGLIIAGVTWLLKRYIDLNNKERTNVQKEFYTNLKKDLSKEFQESVKKSEEDDKILQNQIDEVKDEMRFLKKGMLSMQGREFRANCARVLEENHILTLEEYEQLEEDHSAYNGLGGNHRGDSLFELVKIKAGNTLGQK